MGLLRYWDAQSTRDIIPTEAEPKGMKQAMQNSMFASAKETHLLKPDNNQVLRQNEFLDIFFGKAAHKVHEYPYSLEEA